MSNPQVIVDFVANTAGLSSGDEAGRHRAPAGSDPS